ncbi:uncharacterized protein EI90DRAFT_3038687 [Cantharellus anzutake]|uniref:uncharacterized protein n=1 Tax=Cantharellus anzutake TaxID=1750568 RepID=UPI0019032564|nr:uncharacterized protein EI90DRAFT_3038687 [Cantharellus anzutake]KAF8339979.1 hypothetical protein EI90DRAFT_3038687 [Cantharellus anzutake]
MFETPKTNRTRPQKAYTAREKSQILENLDIEFEARLKGIRIELDQCLDRILFVSRNRITRISEAARNITLREFGATYGGNYDQLVRGIATMNTKDLDNLPPPTVSKRKRDDASDAPDVPGDTGERRAKTARQVCPSPKKTKGPLATPGVAPSSSRRLPSSRINATPSRLPSKPRLPPLNFPSRPSQPAFPHSSSVFRAPDSKTPLPAYPRSARPDEVLMSENGSPVANPLAKTRKSGPDHAAAAVGIRPVIASVGSPPASIDTGDPSGRKDGSGQSGMSRESERAFLNIQTSTGESVSFDPLLTSPASLASRTDISDSARQDVWDKIARIAEAFTRSGWANIHANRSKDTS